MDNAVGLIRAYLQLNGYFTLAEYPIYEKIGVERFRSVTDLDILAIRFPEVDHVVVNRASCVPLLSSYDHALGVTPEKCDMLIGEVKEGKARLNSAISRAEVLCTGIMRFGCCDWSAAHRAAKSLCQSGHAVLPNGHSIRTIVFASELSDVDILQVSFEDVIRFIEGYVDRNFEALKSADIKDPVMGLFTLAAKARKH